MRPKECLIILEKKNSYQNSTILHEERIILVKSFF